MSEGQRPLSEYCYCISRSISMLIIIFCHVLSMFDNEMTVVMKAEPMFMIVHHGQEFVGHGDPSQKHG